MHFFRSSYKVLLILLNAIISGEIVYVTSVLMLEAVTIFNLKYTLKQIALIYRELTQGKGFIFVDYSTLFCWVVNEFTFCC